MTDSSRSNTRKGSLESTCLGMGLVYLGWLQEPNMVQLETLSGLQVV
jgi:hypothetical protein